MNPFMAFAMEQRPKIIKENPALKTDIGAVGKMLGKLWHQLSDAEKAKYKSRSTTRKVKKTNTKIASNEKPVMKMKTAKKGKRALSGYMKFFKANYGKMSRQNPGNGVTNVAKKIGAAWRELSDAEKKKY